MLPDCPDKFKRFIIDSGPTGFQGFIYMPNGVWELFACSSSMSTFTRMMSDIVKLGTGDIVEFEVKSLTLKENQ